MKVLLINKFHYLKGGSERYYFSLADAFVEAGDEVCYFAMQSEKNLPCETAEFFVSEKKKDGALKDKIKFILSIKYSKEAYKKLTLLLKKEKPDLVILNLVHKQLSLSVVKAIKDYDKNLPIFWTMHDYITVCPAYTLLNGKGENCKDCVTKGLNSVTKNKCIDNSFIKSYMAKSEAKYILKKGYYNLVDLYICPSKFTKDLLLEGNFTTSKIISLTNPLPIKTKIEYNKSDGDYLLYFGRLIGYKGVDRILAVAKAKGVQIIIAGDGPDREKLESFALETGVNATFVGHKTSEELTALIDGAKAVCVPSVWQENCPYSVLESFARSTPVIASNLGGLKELIKDGVNGFLYSTQEEFESAVDKLYGLNGEDYKNLCMGAGEFAKRECDAKEYINKLKEYCKKIKEDVKE